MGRKSAKKSNNFELLSRIETLISLTTNIQNQNFKKLWETYLQCSEILHKINEPKPKTLPRTPEAIAAFKSFMSTNGAKFSNLDLDFFPGYGLGVKALTKLDQGKLLITVPRKLILSEESARKSALAELISKDAILQNMPNVALALYLIFEKYSVESFWESYLKVLPQEYATVLYFTTEELELLKGSPNFESALKQWRSIVRQYAYFKKLFLKTDLPAGKLMRDCFTFEEYRWAVSTVMTRQNAIPSSDGTSMILALIPFWDMINHTNGVMTTGFNTELNQSEYYALEEFQEGGQVLMFYGDRKNNDMFLYSGFVYPDNKHDGYVLQLGISKADPLGKLRVTILEKVNLVEHMMFTLLPSAELDPDLINYVRIFVMNEGELEKLVNLTDAWEVTSKLSELVSDERAYQFLKTRLRLLLAAYKTKLADDLKILEESDPSDCARNAILLRISEKKILESNSNFIEALMKK